MSLSIRQISPIMALYRSSAQYCSLPKRLPSSPLSVGERAVGTIQFQLKCAAQNDDDRDAKAIKSLPKFNVTQLLSSLSANTIRAIHQKCQFCCWSFLLILLHNTLWSLCPSCVCEEVSRATCFAYTFIIKRKRKNREEEGRQRATNRVVTS